MAHRKLAALLSTPLLIAVFSLTATQAQSAPQTAEEIAVRVAECEKLQTELTDVNNELPPVKTYLAVPENAENADAKEMLASMETIIAQLQADIAAKECP